MALLSFKNNITSASSKLLTKSLGFALMERIPHVLVGCATEYGLGLSPPSVFMTFASDNINKSTQYIMMHFGMNSVLVAQTLVLGDFGFDVNIMASHADFYTQQDMVKEARYLAWNDCDAKGTELIGKWVCEYVCGTRIESKIPCIFALAEMITIANTDEPSLKRAVERRKPYSDDDETTQVGQKRSRE